MMKPRLQTAPLTELDRLILVRWCMAHDPRDCICRFYAGADRRDAELMLALREARELCNEQGLRHCILAGRHTALAEYDDPDTSLAELGLAMRIPKL